MDLPELLNGLGIRVELDEGCRISDAVLVTKEVDLSTGEVVVATYESDTTDRVTVSAILAIAAKCNGAPVTTTEGDDQ